MGSAFIFVPRSVAALSDWLRGFVSVAVQKQSWSQQPFGEIEGVSDLLFFLQQEWPA